MLAILATIGGCLLELRRSAAVAVWATSRLLGMPLLFLAVLLVILTPSTTTCTFAAVVVTHLALAVVQRKKNNTKALLTFFPLTWSNFGFVERFLTLILQDAVEYYPLRLKLVDPATLDPKQSYLIGTNPVLFPPCGDIRWRQRLPLHRPALYRACDVGLGQTETWKASAQDFLLLRSE